MSKDSASTRPGAALRKRRHDRAGWCPVGEKLGGGVRNRAAEAGVGGALGVGAGVGCSASLSCLWSGEGRSAGAHRPMTSSVRIP